MHDPLVVAHVIIRPWPQRTRFRAAPAGVRWRARLHHDHLPSCPAEGCSGQPFPWWKPRSYSRFWRVAGRDWYWPPLVTIWHAEPGGADALSVCQRRYQDRAGKWHWTKGWRWHVIHLAWREAVITVTDPAGSASRRVRYPVPRRGWKIQVHPAQAARRRLLTRCAWCAGRDRRGDPVNVGFSWDGPRGRWWQGEPGLYHRDCSGAASAHRQCACTEPAPAHGTWGRCGRCGKPVPHGRTPAQLAETRRLAATPPGRRPAPRQETPG